MQFVILPQNGMNHRFFKIFDFLLVERPSAQPDGFFITAIQQKVS